MLAVNLKILLTRRCYRSKMLVLQAGRALLLSVVTGWVKTVYLHVLSRIVSIEIL